MNDWALYQADMRITTFMEMNVDPETGEMPDEKWAEFEQMVAAVDGLEMSVLEEAKNERAIANAIKAEKLALAARQSTHERRADRLEDIIKRRMLDTGRKKLENARVEATIRKNKVVQVDTLLLPEQWYRVKKEVDKAGIKKAITEGQYIPGASLEETYSISIKGGASNETQSDL